jgi:hypothetical protein
VKIACICTSNLIVRISASSKIKFPMVSCVLAKEKIENCKHLWEIAASLKKM